MHRWICGPGFWMDEQIELVNGGWPVGYLYCTFSLCRTPKNFRFTHSCTHSYSDACLHCRPWQKWGFHQSSHSISLYVMFQYQIMVSCLSNFYNCLLCFIFAQFVNITFVCMFTIPTLCDRDYVTGHAYSWSKRLSNGGECVWNSKVGCKKIKNLKKFQDQV